VAAVLTAEEAFGLGQDQRLPDVVIQFADDVVGDNALGASVVVPTGELGPYEGSGGHSREGVLIAAGAGVRPGRYGTQSIEGGAATVLSYLGVSPPAGMTTSFKDLFEPDRLMAGGDGSWEVEPRASDATVTPREEEEILESLRGLGYLE
jgi:hypothetical protein